jgi:hypothetical protein
MESSGRSFLDQYANDASSFAETCCSTTSRGVDPPPVSLPASLANATQGSCLSLTFVQELGRSCRPPPPAASRRPVDPVGINAESLSSGFSHPDLEYDRSGSRGFPHPIPYGAYHPFTPINRGGHGCQVSINGGYSLWSLLTRWDVTFCAWAGGTFFPVVLGVALIKSSKIIS